MTLQPIVSSAEPLRFQPPARFYDGAQTARAVGLSLERFRKVRLGWVADRDFPSAISEPGEPIRYLADTVDRWVERRARRVAAPPPEPRETPASPAAGRTGRAALRKLKGLAPC